MELGAAGEARRWVKRVVSEMMVVVVVDAIFVFVLFLVDSSSYSLPFFSGDSVVARFACQKRSDAHSMFAEIV